MIDYETTFVVRNLTANDITEFMLNCNDDLYRRWWPGVHLAFHTIRRRPGDVGNLVIFDEYVGNQRLRFRGVVETYEPGRKIVWRLKKIVFLPAYLSLVLEDTPEGVQIRHSLRMGIGGQGSALDGIIKAFMHRTLEQDLAQHARTEFGNLKRLLVGFLPRGPFPQGRVDR